MKAIIRVSYVLIAALSFVGCSRQSPPAAPPVPEVVVATVTPRDVPVIREGVATLDGFITANINAQVQGYLVSRDYKEGSLVRKGDRLFQIDPRPFEAALAQAQGNLATAQANQAKADADIKRALDLFAKKVISDQERDSYIQGAKVGKANVQSAEAAVKQSELNLSYTTIIAPIDGIAGIANAQVGDLVGPATGPLTALSQVDPIKATINVGEQAFTEFLTKHPDADEREQFLKTLQFALFLGNGTLYPKRGEFYAQDRNIDPKTGAIRVELTFANPGNRLRPGQFGKVRAVMETEKGAPVIPQEAVADLQGRQMVAVVSNDNTVAMRPVTMGERAGALWQVIDGLSVGERVVVEGMQKVPPGTRVRVKDWTPPAPQLAANGSLEGKER